MKRKILALSIALLMVLSVVLVGCDLGSLTGGKAQVGGTVRRAIWSAPPGVLHPSLYEDSYDNYVLSLIYEGMVQMNPDMEYESCLAEKWKVSDDQKSVTFTLREDLKWHDGKPITTEDVLFTFEFIAHPDYTGSRYSGVSAIKGIEAFHTGESDTIEGIEIIDERTIKITTEEIYAPFMLDIGSRTIVPKHIWGEIPVAKASEQTELLRNPIGSGPFMMKHFEPDQYVELVAYEDYWDGRPNLDNFIITVVNQETAQAQMINGEIDFMDMSSLNNDDISFLEDGGVIVKQLTSDGYQYMGLNNRLDIFKDKNVRQAFAYAINRQAIVDDILDGNGSVCNVPLPPGHWAYPKKSKEYKYNKDKAIELFEKAGWEYKDGKMYRNGNPVKLTLKYPSGNKVREASAPLIQQNLADVGIEVELLLMEFGTLLDQVVTEQDFEMFLMAWSLTPDPDGTEIWHSDYINPNQFNFAGFVNDKNDELLEEGVKYLSVKERKPIYEDWGKLMNEEMPIVYLYSMNKGFALNPKLKGLKLYSFADYYQVHKWYLEK